MISGVSESDLWAEDSYLGMGEGNASHVSSLTGKTHASPIAGFVFLTRHHENSRNIMKELVSLVDDDESVRESLPDLLRELGFDVAVFSSAEQFLASPYINETNCLILDIAMPGMRGPELKRELENRHLQLPIVFITAHRDETVRLQLLEQGAIDCLFKPFTESELSKALNKALGR